MVLPLSNPISFFLFLGFQTLFEFINASAGIDKFLLAVGKNMTALL